MTDSLKINDFTFNWGERTYLMGILNLTPDSFAGDGVGNDLNLAEKQAREFSVSADLLDIGAESTRPSASFITAEDELQRLLPALRLVRKVSRLPISVDTYKPEIAREALANGADIINDIHGLQDPAMLELAVESAAPVILMHSRGDATTMMSQTDYGADIIATLLEWFDKRLETVTNAGVERGKLIIDPGIGFAKTFDQNLEILHRLPEFKKLGLPLLVGLSRKGFIGQLVAGETQPPAPPNERDYGTAAGIALAVAGGADIVRVHNVAAQVGAMRVADAITRRAFT